VTRQLPSLPTYRHDVVTRRLCAAVHLDEDFARRAEREFTGDGMTAIGLPLGVNVVALVRHARAALARVDRRERRLAWLSLALVAAVLGAVVGAVAGASWLGPLGVAVALAVLGTAWWTVYRSEADSRRAALAVFHSDTRPAELAAAAPPELENRLRELRQPNVLPYTAAAERESPFVGSGTKIKESVWQPIDVSRPAAAPGGGKLAIKPFDAVDLHTYVAREMEKIAGLDGLRAQNRLYVIGTLVPHLGPELLPDRLGRPLPRIPKQLVQAGLVRPGAGMRAYLCLERVGEGGRVIVSMILRARLQHPSLSWEVAAYAIPPLSSRFDRVAYLPLNRFERWRSLVGYATSRTWPELRGSLGRRNRRRVEARRRAAALRRSREDITERHLAFDYGAQGSLREWCGDWERMGHSDRNDSQDYLHRLQQGVLTATERFLEAHHVDTGSFARAQQVISTQTYNFAGDVTGPSNFGNHGQINQGQPGQGGSGGVPSGSHS
jgi:hypothetical protein